MSLPTASLPTASLPTPSLPPLRLVSHHLCPYVQRAAIVLSEKEIPHERIYIDLADKPDWFRAVSPLGRTPVLLAGEVALFESQVIAEYLDEVTPGSLHPADPLDKARHRAWIEFGSTVLAGLAGLYNAADEAAFDDRRDGLRAMFGRVEAEIGAPYFAGERFHLIDGVWGTIFRYFDVLDTLGEFGILDGLPRIAAWRAAVAGRPSVRDAVPDGYPGRLRAFLAARNSHLAGIVAAAA